MIVYTVDVRAAFGKIADRFDALADKREQEQFVSRPPGATWDVARSTISALAPAGDSDRFPLLPYAT